MFYPGICVEIPYFQHNVPRVELAIGEARYIASNNYPFEYPAGEECTRRFISTDKGFFKVTFVDISIGNEDNIGIGWGLNPSFASTIYAASAVAKMPIRDNHPKSIFIPPTLFGTSMWIVFGVVNRYPPKGPVYYTKSLHQFDTIDVGFLVEISLVTETGNNTDFDMKCYSHIYPPQTPHTHICNWLFNR